jgi:hypothetical protein
MSKARETMTKRRVVLEDGRYLIFFTFAPSDPSISSRRDAAEKDAKARRSAEDN